MGLAGEDARQHLVEIIERDVAADLVESGRTQIGRQTVPHVAAAVHRGGAGVGGLAAEVDAVPLDPEGAEDGAEREVHVEQHRPLLDVQLEVGGGVGELPARLEHAVEVDADERTIDEVVEDVTEVAAFDTEADFGAAFAKSGVAREDVQPQVLMRLPILEQRLELHLIQLIP